MAAVRPLLPGLVALQSRLDGAAGRLEDIEATGLLGVGGRAATRPAGSRASGQ
ncbi:hypothetical protein [Streptomyces sp. NPDC001315]|uniref:hypothetical protein n=1 Tax=Streptomyces sp. NPDC001315 TaxID=3364562 RepID=UPI0036884E48